MYHFPLLHIFPANAPYSIALYLAILVAASHISVVALERPIITLGRLILARPETGSTSQMSSQPRESDRGGISP